VIDAFVIDPFGIVYVKRENKPTTWDVWNNLGN
jgi:hypothetical protein